MSGPKFVELTLETGRPLWLNVEQIASVMPAGEEPGGGSYIRDVTDVDSEAHGWHVEEQPDEVLNRIEACS